MLKDMNLTEFTDILSSSAPAPGGGSAAALEGAIGSSLTAMVASLTIGKKKYAEYEELANETLEKANKLKNDFITVMDKDTETFDCMSAVFALPKNTDEEKAERKTAMQVALKKCCECPYEMMKLSLEALKLTNSIVGKSNQSASSDLGVAALSLKAAIQGAWLNVLINISSINDEDFVLEFKNNGEAILNEALPLADKIYNEVVSNL